MESSPARDRRSTTVPRHQPIKITLKDGNTICHVCTTSCNGHSANVPHVSGCVPLSRKHATNNHRQASSKTHTNIHNTDTLNMVLRCINTESLHNSQTWFIFIGTETTKHSTRQGNGIVMHQDHNHDNTTDIGMRRNDIILGFLAQKLHCSSSRGRKTLPAVVLQCTRAHCPH